MMKPERLHEAWGAGVGLVFSLDFCSIILLCTFTRLCFLGHLRGTCSSYCWRLWSTTLIDENNIVNHYNVRVISLNLCRDALFFEDCMLRENRQLFLIQHGRARIHLTNWHDMIGQWVQTSMAMQYQHRMCRNLHELVDRASTIVQIHYSSPSLQSWYTPVPLHPFKMYSFCPLAFPHSLLLRDGQAL